MIGLFFAACLIGILVSRAHRAFTAGEPAWERTCESRVASAWSGSKTWFDRFGLRFWAWDVVQKGLPKD